MSLKILGRVGTHIFFKKKKFWKNINFMHFERHFGKMPFKMHKIYIFSRKPEKILGFTSKFKHVSMNEIILC